MNDNSEHGITKTLFTFHGSETTKPVFRSEKYPHTINLKMNMDDIMTHFYKTSMEEYKKQKMSEVLQEVMTPSILCFDISDYSSKYDFCNNFTINLNKVNEKCSDTDKTYSLSAVMLKKPSKKTGSMVFVFDSKQKIFKSLEYDEILGFEEVKNSFVTMVFYEEKGAGEDDNMEMI